MNSLFDYYDYEFLLCFGKAAKNKKKTSLNIFWWVVPWRHHKTMQVSTRFGGNLEPFFNVCHFSVFNYCVQYLRTNDYELHQQTILITIDHISTNLMLALMVYKSNVKL